MRRNKATGPERFGCPYAETEPNPKSAIDTGGGSNCSGVCWSLPRIGNVVISAEIRIFFFDRCRVGGLRFLPFISGPDRLAPSHPTSRVTRMFFFWAQDI